MGVYVSEMVKAMKKLDSKNTYVLFKGKFLYATGKQGLAGKILTIIKEQLWVQFTIPQRARQKKVDLFYFPNPPTPFMTNVPITLTIPDMSFYYDQSFNTFTKIYLYLMYFLSVRKARCITTFSNNSKKDIVRILGVSKNKVHIVTPALSEKFKKSAKKTVLKVIKNYNISSDYILSVPGTFVPRKGAEDLLWAFNSPPPNKQNKFQLVFVGNNHDGYFESFWRTVKEMKLADKVVCPGYIPLEDLVALYSGARVVICTSYYEGFGLTPLEAMACKVPVIAYKNSSLPEVVKNAGILLDNKGSLPEAILNVLTQNQLRKRLIRLGLERSKAYSWGHSAQKILNLINETER